MQDTSINQVSVHGVSVRFSVSGSGVPLFCLHGWGGSIDSFESLNQELLGNGCMIFRLEFPGFGESDTPKQAWKVKDYADFFEGFVQKMYSKYNLQGDYNVAVHSFGGRVILKHFAEITSDKKCSKLILIGAAGIKNPPSLKTRLVKKLSSASSILNSAVLKPYKNSIRKIFHKVTGADDYSKLSGVMKETFQYVIEEDLSSALKSVDAKSLIIWGRHDSYVPVSDAIKMDKEIPDSKLVILEDGRHGIHRTHSKKIAKLIIEFLNS